ncbi:NPCBM/NEW2 domain-containing protein [Deinococcus koreensis]|uniref:Glycosyl hydrolase n=1 Tax=Deinococcus koreensis TaxID=2054903 RepID=A0A2K3UTB3_9DEIO|nr:NPCBM/NEW2 domain-containing protein [Deinococcus koreensis]PNY79783.1 glycosyl hydrolase [Deinococcus koreensis]
MTHFPSARLRPTALLLVSLSLAACAQPPSVPQTGGQAEGASPYDGVDRSWTATDNGLGGKLQAQAIDPGNNTLSNEGWTAASNGWGPIERNKSNGETAAGDGKTLTLNGKTYSNGFGVHGNSSMTFAVNGQCSTFTSDIGIDDEVGSKGAAVFQVYADGTKLYDSGVMTGSSATKTVNVSISGRRELKLVVQDAGNSNAYDHADWADAKLLSCTVAASGGGVSPAPAPAPSPNVTYQGPLVITKGGTYSGSYQSTNPDVPAISIRTTEPVIIQNANVRGPSHLIAGFNMNLTVRNTRAYGVNPNVAGRNTGRFILSEDTYNLVVENNYMEGTSGIYVRNFKGNRAGGQTIKILRNKVKNIDGRKSNGAGGYQTAFERVQFTQFNDVRDVPNVEIAWNEIINEPGKSGLEENINFYGSTGTASSRLKIHNNFIKGAYNANPATDSGFGGGGIMLGDGNPASLSTAGGYMDVYNNQIVSTSNQGIGIAGGHDHNVYNNRVVSSGLLPDGRKILAQNVGVYVWDQAGSAKSGTWFNNSVHDNQIVWMRYRSDGSSYTNNTWFASCTSSCYNNSSLPAPATLATEQVEYNLWLSKLSSAGIKIGVN